MSLIEDAHVEEKRGLQSVYHYVTVEQALVVREGKQEEQPSQGHHHEEQHEHAQTGSMGGILKAR